MTKTLVIFESKNGFTKKIAEEVSLILGPAKCIRLSELENQNKDYEYIVLCIPVHSETIESSTLEHIYKNSDWLRQKQIIVLFTCRLENSNSRHLQPFKDIFGQSIIFSSFVSNEPFEKEKFIELVLNIKKVKDQGGKALEEEKLKQYVEAFLNAHNTCSLSTGYGKSVRATPIEYIYSDEALYVLSEGGEKFANILLNPNVSVGIFNDYKNMAQLSGMQITGYAEIIDIGCDEYRSVLALKSLKYAQIVSLPIALNMIKIHIRKVEYLWSGFRELNCDAKQILILN